MKHKLKKLLLPLIVAVLLLVVSIVLYKLLYNTNEEDNTDKKVYNLTNKELSFTEYDRITQGKYFLLFDGINSCLINSNGNVLENYTDDVINMIKYFNSETYSDYYYILGDEFTLKKDSKVLATIKYNSLDFDLRKSTSSIYLLDDNNLLLLSNVTNSSTSGSVNVTYAYIYNFNQDKIYPKITSYNGIGIVNNSSDSVFLYIKDTKGYIDLYSVNNHKLVFNKYYPKVGNMDLDNNTIYSLSNKYIYVCSNTTDDNIYSGCGIIDTEGSVKISLKYDDKTIYDYNNDYYVIENNGLKYLYDYSNISKLSEYDYIMLSKKYVIAFKDEVMNIFDYNFNKLKSIDIGFRDVITSSSETNNKNIELIETNDSIIINTYDNESLDKKEEENSSLIKSYIYSDNMFETFKERRLYAYTDINNDVIIYYSPEYNGKSITKVFLYNKLLEGYRIIKFSETNSGKFKIINKCDDLSTGYILDNNYYIYNANYESSGTSYSNDLDYNNAICNSIGDYTVANTILYDQSKQKIAFNQIKNFTITNDNKYLIIHDNKVGVFQ